MSDDRPPARVAATWTRIHFGEVIRRVFLAGETLVVERDGIPMVAIVSLSRYEALRRAAGLPPVAGADGPLPTPPTSEGGRP